jgi:hypothetical protein
MGISVNTIIRAPVVTIGLILLAIGMPVRSTGWAAPAAGADVVYGGVSLHSVSVDIPGSDRTFPGQAEADAINNNCLLCHSAGMVLNQPRLPRAAWQAEVDKMRNIYKAPIAAEDVPAIVNYLATLGDGK